MEGVNNWRQVMQLS